MVGGVIPREITTLQLAITSKRSKTGMLETTDMKTHGVGYTQ